MVASRDSESRKTATESMALEEIEMSKKVVEVRLPTTHRAYHHFYFDLKERPCIYAPSSAVHIVRTCSLVICVDFVSK